MKRIFTLLLSFLVIKASLLGQLSEPLTAGSLPAGWTSSSATDVTFSTATGGYANLVSVGATLTTPPINIPIGFNFFKIIIIPFIGLKQPNKLFLFRQSFF